MTIALWPWPMTLKTFSATSTQMMNICAKFHSDIVLVPCQTGVNRRWSCMDRCHSRKLTSMPQLEKCTWPHYDTGLSPLTLITFSATAILLTIAGIKMWHGKVWAKTEGKGKRVFVQRLVVNTPLGRSGMARVLKGSHSFTCTPRVHPLTEWTIPLFAFPAEAGTHLPTPIWPIMCLVCKPYSINQTDPGGTEGWVGLGWLVGYILK